MIWNLIRSEVISIFLSFSMKAYGDHLPEGATPPPKEKIQNVYQFVLWDVQRSWNDAARICENSGGHILSIDSQVKENLIQSLKKDRWSVLLDHDYWAGITEPKQGLYVWHNCEVLTASSFEHFKGDAYKLEELCFQVKRDTMEWDRRKCSDKKRFICEIIKQEPCEIPNIISSETLANYNNTSPEDCTQHCSNNPLCWSAVSLDWGLCVLLKARTGSGYTSAFQMFEKQCFEVETKNANEEPDSGDSNSDLQPILAENCTELANLGTALPPVINITFFNDTTTIAPTPCSWYQTINITYTHNETEYITVNVTLNETVYVTQSVFMTQSVFVTSSVDITHTSVVISAGSAPVSCATQANVSYSGTNDPSLIEAISSIKKELTVDKKTTNAAIRSLTSAKDDRPSSQAIGMSGICLLVIPMTFILFFDLVGCCRGKHVVISKMKE